MNFMSTMINDKAISDFTANSKQQQKRKCSASPKKEQKSPAPVVLGQKDVLKPKLGGTYTLNKPLKQKQVTVSTPAIASASGIPNSLRQDYVKARDNYMRLKSLVEKANKSNRLVEPQSSFISQMLGLDELTQEVSRFNDTLNRDETVEALKGFNQFCVNSSEAANTFNSVLQSIGDGVTGVLASVQDLLSGKNSLLLKSLVLGLTLYVFRSDLENKKEILMGLALVHLYAWRSEIGRFPGLFLKFVCSFDLVIKEVDVIVPNSDMSCVYELIKTIATSIFLYITGKDMDITNVKEITWHIGQFGRVSSGITSLVDYASSLIKMVLKFISLTIYGDSRLTWSYDGNSSEIDYLISSVDRLVKMETDSVIPATVETLEQVNKLTATARKIKKELPKNRDSAPTVSTINDIVKYLSSARTTILMRKPSLENRRVEPVGIYLAGAPGTAKTETLEWMSRTIHHLLYYDTYENPMDKLPQGNIYSIKKHKYMDGYTNQRIILMDDIFQKTDVIGEEDSEALKIIEMINTPALRLNMADLDSKGTTYFKGEFVLCSSNSPNPHVQSIVSTEAMMRRFDFKYYVYPKQEYCRTEDIDKVPMEKHIDYSKLPVVNGRTVLNPIEVLEYLEYDPKTLNPVGGSLSFIEVMDRLLAKSILKREWFDTAQTEIANFLRFDLPDELLNKSNLQNTDYIQNEFIHFFSTDVSKRITWLNAMVTKYEPQHHESCLLTKFEKIRNFVFNHNGTDIVPNWRTDIILMIYKNPTWEPSYTQTPPYWNELSPKIMNIRSALTNLSQGAKSILEASQEAIRKVLGCDLKLDLPLPLAMALPAILVYFGGGALNGLFKTLWTSVTPESSNPKLKSKDLSGNLAERYVKFKEQKTSPSVLPHSSNSSHSNMLDTKISRNLMTFVHATPGDDQGKKAGFALALRDRTITFPYHFVTRLFLAVEKNPERADLTVILTNPQGKRIVVTNDYILRNHYGSPDLLKKDFCLLDLPVQSQPFKDITSMFYTSKEFSNVHSNTTIKMYTYNNRILQATQTPASYCRSTRVDDISSGEYYTLESLYIYDCIATVGDCGAPFVNPNTGKIMGFHVAGQSKICGYGKIMCLDWFDLPEKVPIPTEPESVLPFVLVNAEAQYHKMYSMPYTDWSLPFKSDVCSLTLSGGKGPLPFGKQIIGSISPSPSAPTKTSLVKSRMYGKLTVQSKRYPAVLFSPQVDVLQKSYDKYCVNDSVVNPEILQSAVRQKLHHLNTLCEKDSCRREVQTFEQAVSGYLESYDDPFATTHTAKDMGGLNMSTSAGFPGNILGLKKKRDYFYVNLSQTKPDFNLNLAKEEKASCERIIDQFSQCVPSLALFTDFPKDELRSEAKVFDLDTRLIAGSSQAFTIVVKMYCGDFCQMMLDTRIKNNSGLGINERSDEWEILFKHLTKFGLFQIVGDYKAYDANHTVQLIMAVATLMNMWYRDSEENQRVRISIFFVIAHSVHIRNGQIHAWNGGMPSGNALTPIINTIINELVMIMIYEISVPKELGRYHKNVCGAFVGDDNIQGVKPDVLPYFNGKVVEKVAWDMLKYKFTSEDKIAEIQEYKSIYDSTFLKRKWRKDPHYGRHSAPLDINTLYDMCAWGNVKNHDAIQYDKVNTALLELAEHGFDTFERVSQEFVKLFETNYPGSWILTNTDFLTIVEDYRLGRISM